MRQFQNEGLDFEVFGLKGFSILFRLIQQRLNQRHHLCFGGSIKIQLIQLAQYFPWRYFTIKTCCSHYKYGFIALFQSL